MESIEYTADYFIQDEYFQRWVYSPDPESDIFWSEFSRTNPSYENAMNEAKLFLSFFTKDLEQGESRIQKIKEKISETIDPHNHLARDQQEATQKKNELIEAPDSSWEKFLKVFGLR